MSRFEHLLTKARAVIKKGPSTLRNVVYSRLEYWPVARIDGADLQSVPTYCISLQTAHKRRALISRQARGLGLTNFSFLNAVDASALSKERLKADGIYDENQSMLYHSKGLTINEIACSLSHGLAYAKVSHNGDEVALIIEDDALFVTRRMRDFTLAEIPVGFDVVFLNAFRLEEPPLGRIRGGIYDMTSYHGSAAAYLVSQAGARKLLGAHLPVIHAADGLLGRCMELRSGEVHPFKQVGAPTTIKSYMTFPDCIHNGSTCYYHVSDVQLPLPRNS